jgi:GTP cyclohydrolase I
VSYKKIEQYTPETSEKLEHHYREVIKLLGENADREGLLKTPERVSKAMQFVTHGYDVDPVQIVKSAIFHEDHKEMVIVKDIELYSLCEHHMLPFFGKAHVAYIPNGGYHRFKQNCKSGGCLFQKIASSGTINHAN